MEKLTVSNRVADPAVFPPCDRDMQMLFSMKISFVSSNIDF